jgi:signal peptidase II
MKNNKTAGKLFPFSLTLLILVLDQASKAAIATTLRIGERVEVLGSFLWLWHVRNKGIAFSMGSGLPAQIRAVLFTLLPLAVLAILLVYYFRARDITGMQRWCFAAILGGGLGNLADRLIRTDGVVDFISVKFYGLLGMERYPTFNVADSSVVIAVVIMIVSLLFFPKRSLNE